MGSQQDTRRGLAPSPSDQNSRCKTALAGAMRRGAALAPQSKMEAAAGRVQRGFTGTLVQYGGGSGPCVAQLRSSKRPRPLPALHRKLPHPAWRGSLGVCLQLLSARFAHGRVSCLLLNESRLRCIGTSDWERGPLLRPDSWDGQQLFAGGSPAGVADAAQAGAGSTLSSGSLGTLMLRRSSSAHFPRESGNPEYSAKTRPSRTLHKLQQSPLRAVAGLRGPG